MWRVVAPAGGRARGASARARDGLLLAAVCAAAAASSDTAPPEPPRATAARGGGGGGGGAAVALRQAAHGEGQLARRRGCAEDGAAEDGAARCALAASCSFYDHALRVWPLPADRGGGVF